MNGLFCRSSVDKFARENELMSEGVTELEGKLTSCEVFVNEGIDLGA